MIATEHSYNVFGYLDSSDLKNEIWVICLEVLPNYNAETGPLEHFLRVSVKNRLVNRFKEITKSVRSPCTRCPFYNPVPNLKRDCKLFKNSGTQKSPLPGRMSCDKWKNYKLSIKSRNSLLNPIESMIEQATTISPLDELIGHELYDIIYKNLDCESQKDLNTILSNRKLNKIRLDKLRKNIKNILKSRNLL